MHCGWSWIVGGLAACAVATTGCGEENHPASACPSAVFVCGECAGVPAESCSGDCASGLNCIDVTDAIGLSLALVGAGQGACFRLHQGTYGAVDLPGGVTLIGDSAGTTTLSKLTIGAGDQSTVRSLGVIEEGITLTGATNAYIESVQVSSSIGDGIHVGAGSSVAILASEIVNSGRYGVYMEESTSVTLERTIIARSEGPGVWAQAACDDDCTCSSQPTLTMKSSLVHENRINGISLVGASATLTCVDVTSTHPGGKFYSGYYGGGISASCGSQVTAKSVHVLDSADYGVLIDGSKAELGGDGEDEGIEVSKSGKLGLWIQNVACPDGQGPCVTLHHGTLSENKGVGIGVAGGSRGIIICKSAVSGTVNRTLSVLRDGNIGASEEVGDGLNWLDTSQVTIEELSLSGNARRSVLIDGPVAAGSSIGAVIQTGGDETSGILQQNLAMGQQPQNSGGVPLTIAPNRQFSIPNVNPNVNGL